MRVFQLLPHDFINRRYLGIAVRYWIPTLIILLLFAGIFSPLFDLTQLHGVHDLKLYMQHFYFDFIAGLGGYYAATFCEHWYHRIPLFIAIDIATTFCLVTLIG